MPCNMVHGKYCSSRGRNGFCHKHLMLCGSDEVLFLDVYTKYKLEMEVRDNG